MKLARPPKAKGPAKRYSIKLPCIVNSSLNCWFERWMRPPVALVNWRRMARAIRPARKNMTSDVYM
jgi:hypothetical protein